MSTDWKEFTRRIPIKASPKTIYEAWTTQQGLESWFLRFAQFTKPDGKVRLKNSPVEQGDKFEWMWFGHDDKTVEKSEVLSVNGWDTLQFRFAGECIVTVTIKQEQGETICELVQEMPQEEAKRQFYFIDCGLGWTFYMTNLKSVLEGGLDLRNKNMKLKEVINS